MKSNPTQKSLAAKKAKRTRARKRFYYSVLTFILAICLIQALRGLFLNIQNYFSLNGKISQLENIQQESKETNKTLKTQIKEFQSLKGVETVARNELKMAGKDEVLVIIKNGH